MKRETKAEPAPAEAGSISPMIRLGECLVKAHKATDEWVKQENQILDLTAREKKLILRNGLLRQEKAELLEALRDTVNELEYATSEIETCDMAERTMRVFGKARTILAKIGGKQ